MTGEFFPATGMPDPDWWQVLWPNPKEVLQKAGCPTKGNLLDLCCGDGHFTKPMCDLVESGSIYALDMHEDLLQEAIARCEGFPNFHSILGDATQLQSHLEEPLDYILIANTFHGIPDKVGFMQSVEAALAAGGHLAVINWYPLPRAETIVLGEPRGPKEEMRMSVKEVEEIAAQAGLRLEQVVDVSPYHYAAIFEKA